ncbi:MAG: helix-turn-helix domain-containing protein [Clostridia bacterium]
MAPDYSVIGKRIKEARNNQNLTQEELADELNISVAFLSRVETGKSHINLKRLTQIAEFLKVSPGYLLTGSNTTSKDYLKEDFKNILDKCSPEQQKLIYEISELVSKTKFESVKTN